MIQAFKMDPNQSQPQTQTPPQPKKNILLRAVPPRNKLVKFLPIVIIVVIVGAGVFSGLVASSRNKSTASSSYQVAGDENLPKEIKESFAQTFRDQAEGTIEKNADLDKYAQGTHKLIRPGGESQTAYLTSSVLDLDEYLGKKVKVFGETFGSSQVGWLMDVGKVEVSQ